MSDIVERLRRDATCTSHHEAATEIERLREERDRLAAELAKAHRDIIPWIDRVGRLSAELESQQPKSPQPTPRQPRA